MEEAQEPAATSLLDLPSSILIDVLSRISDPVHLASVSSASRQLRDSIGSIPWKLRVDTSHDEKFMNTSWHRPAVAMIRARMHLTRALNLSECSITDDDIACLLGCLRHLEVLVLDKCQKLTSSVVDALAVSVRSGPRALSLQRCFRIGPAAAGNLLAAAAADGSRLQCILLSHLDRIDVPRDSPYLEENEVEFDHPAQPVDNFLVHGYGLRILALHNCGGLGTFELAAVAATCPLLEFMLLGGSVEALGLSRVESLSTEKIAAATTAVVDLARSLSRLQMLELTFFTQPVVHAVREELTNRMHIWDFCEEHSLATAVSLLEKLSTSESNHEDVSLALAAAANCSDIRRRTPLHWAAALGEAQSAKCLIQIGAATKGMKDSSGASPIFIAAEVGHAQVCKVLLEGGADIFSENRAGENPIYIAALKGHCQVLEVILSFCALRGWNWQDVKLYGDGWTPLMAAAVADRQDIGRLLLPSPASSKLLNAQNRHGQTALHIAARRCSVWFVTNLLAAGASADVPDEYGQRALDVAIVYRHRSVIEILRQWDSQQSPGASPALNHRRAPNKPSTAKIWRVKTPKP